MFPDPIDIAPARITGILRAAEAAARAIPPAFPLSATVAVNPFLGQTGEDLATAAARLARVAGVAITRPRAELAAEVAAGRITDDDLAAALRASTAPAKPADLALLKAKLAVSTPASAALPTVADLAASATGTDWTAVIKRAFGLWAAGQFDRGQALWTPAPGQGAFAAWRAWASHDLTPEIAGLKGFCAHVAASPDTPDRSILRASERLGITEDAALTAFHRLLMDLGGWAQHARWLLWEAELKSGSDATITDLLAIRLIWEEALMAHSPPKDAGRPLQSIQALRDALAEARIEAEGLGGAAMQLNDALEAVGGGAGGSAGRAAAGINETSSAAQVAAQNAKDAVRGLLQQLASALADQAFMALFGGMFGGGGPIAQSAWTPSFSGGAETVNGPRTGGLDGQGGFLAMMHPRETVVDHAKGQSGGVTIINQIYARGAVEGTAETIRRALDEFAPKLEQRAVAAVVNHRRRGFTA